MSTSIQAQTAIVLVLWRLDATGRPEVCLLQRPAAQIFFAGFWGFAEAFADTAWLQGWQQSQQAAHNMANFVLWTHRSLGHVVWGLSADAWATHTPWPDAQAHPDGLREALDKHLPALADAHCRHLGTWQTPPCIPHAYNTHYVALQMPQAPLPTDTPSTPTYAAWLSPNAALSQHRTGQRYLDYPTQQILQILCANQDFESNVHAIKQCLQDDPTQRRMFAHGIRMQPLPTYTLPPSTHTNCYVLGTKQLVIVDPGTPHADAQRTLIQWLSALCQQGATLSEIWLTHAHPDHTGAVACLQQHFEIPVAAHQDTADFLHQGKDIVVGRTLQDNQTIHLEDDVCWQALWTPGHAPGHLSFYDPVHQHLLSGDHVLGFGTSLVPPAPFGSMHAYMQSLDKILKLPLGLLFPGHGPVVAQAQDRVRRVQTHRLAREQQILAVLAHHPQDLEQLLQQIYPDIQPAARHLAKLNLTAHLEKLVQDQCVTQHAGIFRRIA